jgi:putative ABC transport system permease protein
MFTLAGLLFGLEDWLAAEFGLFLSYDILSTELMIMAGLVFLSTLIVSLIPGIEAYKNALHTQLSGK